MLLPRHCFTFRALSQQCPRASSSFNTRLQFNSGSSWRYFTSNAPPTKRPSSLAFNRHLSTSKPRQTKAKPSSSSKSTSSTSETISLKFAGRRPEGFGKLERKVIKEGTVTLFKAPSHRIYIVSAYTFAAISFSYALYHSNIVFRDPILPLKTWQKAAYGFACVLMSAMGTAFIIRTFKLVKSVTAINGGGGLDGQKTTYIRFQIRRAIPFMKPKQFDVLPRQIAFSRRLVVSQDALDGSRRKQRLLAQKKEPLNFVTFFTAPVKRMRFLFWEFFRSVRQIFTQEDFVFVEVEGQNGAFKMDSNGFVSKDFAYLGHPVSIESSSD